MTSKNPFELRLDILKMAQEMLDREKNMEEQKFNQQVETLREINIGGVNSFVQQNAPKMYTPEDVKSRAESLYSFITTNTSNTTSNRK